MPAKLTLYPPHRAPRFLIVRDGETLEIGRDPECGLSLEDAHVSKRHARLVWKGSGWAIEDLGSKNGTTVGGRPARGEELQHGDWISFGGLVARFEKLTATQAANLDTSRLARLQTTADMRRRLGADLEPLDLLLHLLELAMELTGGERGFVLVARPDGELRPEVAAGFSVEDVWNEGFRGSVGAVKEALATDGLVFVSNAIADPRPAPQPSLVAKGIASLVCLPLHYEERRLGVLYVDSLTPTPRFSALEVLVLESLSDHAAAILSKLLRRQRRRPEALSPNVGLIAQLRERFAELLPTA